MAQLTGDQITTILKSQDFIDRMATVMKQKALYWKLVTTPLRADVNRRIQKRKRYAKALLSNNILVDYTMVRIIAQYWLLLYQTASPDMETINGVSIPTYSAMFADNDPTFDNFAGYLLGDENETEIDW